MKKFTRLLVMTLAVIAAMTACQSEDVMSNTADNEVAVRIGVQTEDVVQSRNVNTSVSDITGYHLRYILEVWTQGDTPQCYTRVVKAAEADKTATFDLTLLAGRTFYFLIWADYTRDGNDEGLHYNTDNLKTITKRNYTNDNSTNDEEKTNPEFSGTRDAFFACEAVTVTPDFNKTITLRRAVAQLNIYATDYGEITNPAFLPTYTSIAMPEAPEGFNVLTGLPYGAPTDETAVNVAVNTTPVTDKGYKMFTGYYFTSSSGKSLSNFDVHFKTADDATVSTYRMELIPMQQNYRTNIIGALLTNTGKLTVETEAAFNEPDYTVPKGPLPTEDGIYYSLDGGEWTEWTSTENNYTMPEGTYTAFVVATVGTNDAHKIDYLKLSAIAGNSNLAIIDLSGAKWDTSSYLGSKMFENHTNLQEFKCPTGLTYIQSNMFQNCSNLRNVELPAGMISIGLSGFDGCKSLKKIELPETVTKIHYRAFGGCENLESINLKNVTEYPLNKTSSNAFQNCYKLDNVELSSSLTEIPYGLFQGCTMLSDIKFSANLTEISSYAFKDCKSLTAFTIPTSVTTIGAEAFRGTALTSIILPESVTEINMGVFKECKSLTSVNLHNKITKIGQEAFYRTALGKTITIPSSVNTFGMLPFGYIQTLEEATIEEGTGELVFDRLFFECRNLKKVTFPKNTKQFKARVLMGCKNLAEIYCYAEEAPIVTSSDFGEVDNGVAMYTGMDVPVANRKLYVPAEAKASYTAEIQSNGEPNYWKTILQDELNYTIEEIKESSTSPDPEEGE